MTHKLTNLFLVLLIFNSLTDRGVVLASTEDIDSLCEKILSTNVFHQSDGRVFIKNENVSSTLLDECLERMSPGNLKLCPQGETWRFLKNPNYSPSLPVWNIISTKAEVGEGVFVINKSSICGASKLTGNVKIDNSYVHAMEISNPVEFNVLNSSFHKGGKLVSNLIGNSSNVDAFQELSVNSNSIILSSSSFHGPVSIIAEEKAWVLRATLGEKNFSESRLNYTGGIISVDQALLKGMNYFDGPYVIIARVTFLAGSTIHSSSVTDVTAGGHVSIGHRSSLQESTINGSVSITNSCPTSTTSIERIVSDGQFSYSFAPPGGDSYGTRFGEEGNPICYWPGPSLCYEFGLCI